MRIKKFLSSVLLLSLICLTSIIYAQENTQALTLDEQKVVIDSIASKLEENYVFPEVAKEMTLSIQTKLQGGSYNSVLDPHEFANTLTEDLRDISHDKHLRVSFAPERIKEQQQVISAEDSLEYLKRRINRMRRNNYGFKEVKILSGNVGYLDLRGFSDVEYGGETAVAAMNFLSNSDAIIIDLRNNGGGSPAMIQLITSYLFESEAVHLNNFYWRPTNSNSQTWTLPHVSGTRSPNTPVYVLTSSSTFSAAEEFSYNLKNLDRATLIGETTGGGAHPGGSIIATDRFMIWVPTGRAINPITNTNWEGTGVSPHIAVPAGDALEKAQQLALENLIKKNNDEDLIASYEWPLVPLRLKNNPVSLNPEVLNSYAGKYGPRVISLESNKLFYQREGGTKYELCPYSKSEFILKGLDNFRIRFLFENDQVIALEGLYESGRTDKNNKG